MTREHADTRRWIGDVLTYWFDTLRLADWFGKRPVVDQTIARRFGGLNDALSREATPGTLTTAEACLAAVLVLDQFSRHLFRGDPRSFDRDPLALAIAEHAVEAGFDRHLPPVQRLFLYLPFEHAEENGAQQRSIEVMASIDREQPGILHYAMLHKVIIDRFGRFPHRNAVLGRTSAAEEIAFLQGPNSSF